MKKTYLYIALLMGASTLFSSCSDFLDREPITAPNNESFLSGESQVRGYINGLYTALPSLQKFGMGVRGEEKNSDNILSEIYDRRLNGEETVFSSNQAWETGYKNLRNVNYFFHYSLNPQLHSRSATYIKRNGLLIRKITIKSSRPFQCAYHPLTP